MDLISIILPVFNAEIYLNKCLNSIINQSFKNWELIIVNDGSTDKSLEISNYYATKNFSIKVFSQKNSGPSAARNLGLKKANGEYIAFIDADDTIQQDYLKLLFEAFKKTNSVDLVCCNYIEYSIFNPNGIKINSIPNELQNKLISNIQYSKYLFQGVNGVLWGKLFKYSIIKKNKLILDKRIKLSEDLIFVLEYLIYVKFVISIDCELYNYNRLNTNMLSGSLKIENIIDLKLTNQAIKNLAPKLNLNEKKLIQMRESSFFKNLTYDLILTKNTSDFKKEKIKKIKVLTSNFANLNCTNLKDRIHIIFLKKEWFLLDSYFLIIYKIINRTVYKTKQFIYELLPE